MYIAFCCSKSKVQRSSQETHNCWSKNYSPWKLSQSPWFPTLLVNGVQRFWLWNILFWVGNSCLDFTSMLFWLFQKLSEIKTTSFLEQHSNTSGKVGKSCFMLKIFLIWNILPITSKLPGSCFLPPKLPVPVSLKFCSEPSNWKNMCLLATLGILVIFTDLSIGSQFFR